MNRHGVAVAHKAYSIGEEFKDAETIDVGFKTIADDVVEAFLFGVHDHDGECDTVAAKVNALIAIGYGEVVDMRVLQDTGHFGLAGTIGGGFDHGHKTGGRLDERAVVVEIGDKIVEVDLHDGLVGFALEETGDIFEVETARSLEEDGFVVEKVEVELTYTFLGSGEEIGLWHVEELAVAFQGFANAYEPIDAVFGNKVGHLGIEVAFGQPSLEYVAYDKGFAVVLTVVLNKIEGNGKGVEVEAVAVVDEQGVIQGFVHFEAHGYGLQVETTEGYDVGGIAKIGEEGDAMECIFD